MKIRRFLAAAAVAGALLLNVGATFAQGPAGEPVVVPIAGAQFLLPELVVPVGTTVTWVNLDGETHDTIDMANGGFATFFESGPIEPGMAYSFTFTQPGFYPYTCTYHANQTGIIIVE